MYVSKEFVTLLLVEIGGGGGGGVNGGALLVAKLENVLPTTELFEFEFPALGGV